MPRKRLNIIKEAIKTGNAAYHEGEYMARSERAMYNHSVGRHLIAAVHQKTAEEHAAAYYSASGKRIYDPLYTGVSKYISTVQESVNESFDGSKASHKEMADHYDAEVKHLQSRSAAQVAKWYGPNVKPAHAQEAHRRNIAIHKEKAEKHRKLFAELGEAKKEDDEPRSATVFPKAHHWNRAKMAYGVPLSVKLQDIGGHAIDKSGNRVAKKELVKRHAFAAANAASKYSPEEKAAWRSNLIAQRTAAKKARENSDHS